MHKQYMRGVRLNKQKRAADVACASPGHWTDVQPRSLPGQMPLGNKEALVLMRAEVKRLIFISQGFEGLSGERQTGYTANGARARSLVQQAEGHIQATIEALNRAIQQELAGR